jgi:hypothetical protein
MKRSVAPLFLAPLFLAAFATLARAEPAPAAPAPAEPIQAETFDDRLLLAKEAEEDHEFRNYRAAILKRNSRHLTRTMRTCIAKSPKPESKTFVLIADITADGKADAVAVKPDNEVANCFASGFSSVSYPKPPKFRKRDGFPVMMKVRVIR